MKQIKYNILNISLMIVLQINFKHNVIQNNSWLFNYRIFLKLFLYLYIYGIHLFIFKTVIFKTNSFILSLHK